MTNLPIAQWSFACRPVDVDVIRQAVRQLADESNWCFDYEEVRLDGQRRWYRLGLKDLPSHEGFDDILILPHNGKDHGWFTDNNGYEAIGIRSRRCVQNLEDPLPDVDNGPLIERVLNAGARLKVILTKDHD